MFGISDTRYKIMLVWLFSFTALWVFFWLIMPMQSMALQLDNIEKSIDNGQWEQADAYTRQFKDNFKRNRLMIQSNNATEALTMFEHTIGQLETTVRHRQQSAVEYVGALKETIRLVIKPFSGP